MALVRWAPTRELTGLGTDVNRLFDSIFFQPRSNGHGVRRWIPAMDLVEEGQSLVLRADLPGVSEDDVSVEVHDNVLTVSGERRFDHDEEAEGYQRVERSYGKFVRTVSLPEGVDQDAVTASFDRGVLEVKVPRPEATEPRKVAIATGAIEESGEK